jgi:hypothetical protein
MPGKTRDEKIAKTKCSRQTMAQKMSKRNGPAPSASPRPKDACSANAGSFIGPNSAIGSAGLKPVGHLAKQKCENEMPAQGRTQKNAKTKCRTAAFQSERVVNTLSYSQAAFDDPPA